MSAPGPFGTTRTTGLASGPRRFGVTLGAALSGAGAWFAWVGYPTSSLVLAGTGVLLIVLAAVAPGRLRTLQRAWLGLADTLARVVTGVVLATIFFGLVTPLGIALRLFGRDPLRRHARGATTYWVPYPARQQDVRHYEKMY